MHSLLGAAKSSCAPSVEVQLVGLYNDTPKRPFVTRAYRGKGVTAQWKTDNTCV